MELYKDKLISYGLGNFLFDQNWSTETQEGAVAKYTFYKKALVKVEITPIVIENQNQTKPASPETAGKIMQHIKESSYALVGK